MIKDTTALIILASLLVGTSCANLSGSTKTIAEGFVTIDVFNGYGNVYFDDNNTKNFSTPIVRHKLPAGSHKIVINRDGYKPIKKTVQVKDDAVTFLSVIMEPTGVKTSEIIKNNRIREKTFYGKSIAIVIGIDDYQYWPQLTNAFNDAQGMERLLADLGFTVYTLYNQKATKEAIKNMISEIVAHKATKDDRVLVFFAGYGQTQELSKAELNYIVPVEGRISRYGTFISLTDFRDWCRSISAKHLFFIMDSCNSEVCMVAPHVRKTGSGAKAYPEKITGDSAGKIQDVRQKGQRVSDDGHYAHSIFTANLIRGIRDQTADLNGDGMITSTELGGYLKKKIFRDSDQQQRPDFGPLTGRDSGEFIFKYPKEYLQGN
jgi:hypothetical protein